MNPQTFRLPRQIEAGPHEILVRKMLSDDTRPLWQGSELMVPFVEPEEALASALRSANMSGLVVRGLQSAQERLDREERGLKLADKRQETNRGGRISRLLILSGDGSRRFYRKVESLLRHYAPRVLAICIETDAATLGEMVFGPGRLVRLLMIEHKDAVSDVLLAMARQHEGA